jgi:hypothetical protein
VPYLKAGGAGVLLVVASYAAVWAFLWFPVSCVRLGSCGNEGIHYDLRAIDDYFWPASVCVKMIIFVVGSAWEFRRVRHAGGK